MKIKHVFLVFVVGVIIFLSAVLSVFTNNRFENFYEEEVNLNAERTVEIAKREIGDYFREISDYAKEFSSDENLKAYLAGDSSRAELVKNYISGSVNSSKSLIQVAVCDVYGNHLPISTGYSERIYQNFTTEILEKQITENYGYTNLNDFVLSNNTKNTFCYVFKIYIGDKLSAYGIFFYNLDEFEEIVTMIESSTRYSLAICDNSGNTIVSPFNSVSHYENIAGYRDVAKSIDKTVKNGDISEVKYKRNRENMIMTGSAVKSTRNKNGGTWSVLASISSKNAAEGVEELESSLAAFASIFTVVIAVVSAWMVLKYLGPIDEIYKVFMKRSTGDSKARFNSKGKNDVVRIGNSVNALIEMLNESEERYKNIVEMTDNIIFEYNVVKNTVTFSDNFNSKFSFRAKSLKFEDSFFINGIVNRKEKADFEAFVDRLLKGESCQDEFSFKTIYGDFAWYIVRCACIKDSNDNMVKVIGAMIDIDRAKRREENLLKKANYDSLTQIFNRQSFEISLMNEYDLSQMRKTRVAVLFVDLDDFKYYNNNFGHALGDEALMFVGATLKRLVGNNGFAGRYGGDEFVVCYSETPSIQSSGELAREIISELGKGFDGVSVNKHFSVKCSVGIAYFTENSMDADSVIKDADEAMYSVKKNGKSDFSYYIKSKR